MARWSYRPRLGAILVLAAVELCLLGAGAVTFVTPAGAQFFDDRFPFFNDRRSRSNSGGGFWNRDYRDRDRDWRDNRPAPPQDFSKAPAARKADPAAPTPTVDIVVMGDSMADWLGYGLETAFADTPEVAVVRKHRHPSGLIRDNKADAADWPQLAREILNADKSAAFAVMMIGLNDRQAIRERPVVRRAPNQPAPAASAAQPGQAAPSSTPRPEIEGEPPAAAPPAAAGPTAAAAEPQAPAGPGIPHEFRSEKWAELYGKRIEETAAALKSKGIPVFWVGLPSIRGAKSTSDVVYLNELYRSHAEKAGITYIDVWDGFIDEAGRFSVQGPDFEGQTRRLRAGDGVHFTQAGARKLAHYVEREIRRGISARGLPVAAIPPTTAPEEPAQPAAPVDKPGLFPRPVAGPVIPLTNAAAPDSTLLGGASSARSVAPETAGNRVLVKGEPVPAPAGRSDDFAWPRRGVLPVGTDPVAATSTEPVPVAQPVQTAPVQTAAGPARPGAADSLGKPAPAVRRTPVVRQQPRYDPWRSNSWGGGWGGGGWGGGGWGGGGGGFRW